MLLYHFPLTSSSATATIVNKGLKDDYTISGDNNFSSGGKLSAYAKDMGENKFYLSISNFSLDYTLCFRAKATSNTLLVSVGYTPFEITADNTWHDYVICDKKVYKDGLFLTNYNYSAGIVAFGDSEDSCQGLIQDIRIYDYALSLAEINEYSRALVVHYPLQGNELNGSVLKDVSGFGNDMQRYGGASSYDNNSPRADKSLHLVNANHCYYQGDMKWSDFASFTISVWIYPTNSSNYRGVFGEGTGMQFVNGIFRIDIASSAFISFTDTDITLNKWIHYVITYSNKQASLYKNGVFVESKSNSITTNFNRVIYLCKSYTENNRYWDGNISDVRIYATALSAEDIKNLYNSPIAVSNQHQTMAIEFKENPLYPSKYWRTPTYDEMNYILNTRTNAANLRTLGRVEISSGTYRNGLFLLPDGFTAPSGITVTITTANYTTNSYTLAQFKQLESVGVVFIPVTGRRIGTSIVLLDNFHIWTGTKVINQSNYAWNMMYNSNQLNVTQEWQDRLRGEGVRLIHNGTHFSTSATTKIDFAPANLQYHCTQHIWRFAEHSYDIIGADNANISDSYNGWIDLFGYGTSGVNYSPTLHTTNNANYASGDISNTDNDWGVNEIQSYDYNVKNFALNKNGIVQHNELRENDSDVNGCYNDKLITNELIEN